LNKHNHSIAMSPSESLILGAQHSRGWRLAAHDIINGIKAKDLWMTFAWNDVIARYRRSRLGQFWITVSVGIFVASIGIFYSQVLGIPVDQYLPYLASGYIAWGFIASVVAEGCSVFIGATGFLTQHRVPLTAFVLRCVQKNILILAHNALVLIAVFLIFPPGLSISVVLIIPAFMLWVLSAIWVVALVGLVSTRFRDMAQIIASVMQIAFLLTPVLWRASDLNGSAQLIAKLNPFTHYLAILRQPLLNQAPDFVSWAVVLSATLLGAALTFLIFARFRTRVPYWL
jgi:ABC-type polysaccharide/polyol phosphate export permease